MMKRNRKWGKSIDELTDKEEEIMRIFWQASEPLYVKDVLSELPTPPPHVNTISTFVRGLETKGFLAHEDMGTAYRYYPIKPMEEYRKKTFSEMIRNYFNNSYKSAVCSLVEDDKLSIEELRELLDMIEEDRKLHPDK